MNEIHEEFQDLSLVLVKVTDIVLDLSPSELLQGRCLLASYKYVREGVSFCNGKVYELVVTYMQSLEK